MQNMNGTGEFKTESAVRRLKKEFDDEQQPIRLLRIDECLKYDADDNGDSDITRWCCFDKGEKIIYGIRLVNGELELRKLNLLLKTEKLVKRFSIKFRYDYYSSNYSFSSKICSVCRLSTGSSVVGVMHEFKPPVGLYWKIFHVILLKTGEIKCYLVKMKTIIDEEGHTDFVYNILKYSDEIGWILRREEKFYRLILNDQTKEGRLEFLTSSDRRDTSMIVQNCLVEICPSKNDHHLCHVHTFNLDTKLWTKRDIKYDSEMFGTGYVDYRHQTFYENSFFEFPHVGGQLLELAAGKNVWLKTNVNILPDSETIEKFPATDYAFITKHLAFVSYTLNSCHDPITRELIDNFNHNEVDVPVEWECTAGIGYSMGVLPLQDLCISKLTKSYRDLFDMENDNRICEILNLPHPVRRKYFGPDWTRYIDNNYQHVSRLVRIDDNAFKIVG